MGRAVDIVMQVLGIAGLIETVLEFTYLLTNRERFTSFEEVFFLASGCIEMMGEVLFMLMVMRILIRDKNYKVLKALVQDPIHNLASRAFDLISRKESEEIAEDYVRGSVLAILVSVLALPVWATFWPVWGSSFDGDGDDDLRLALSICSLALCCMWTFPVCTEKTVFGTANCMVFVMYITEKIFEVYILLSDFDRLCPGDVGKALVAFQLTEITSVAFILACFLWHMLT